MPILSPTTETPYMLAPAITARDASEAAVQGRRNKAAAALQEYALLCEAEAPESFMLSDIFTTIDETAAKGCFSFNIMCDPARTPHPPDWHGADIQRVISILRNLGYGADIQRNVGPYAYLYVSFIKKHYE